MPKVKSKSRSQGDDDEKPRRAPFYAVRKGKKPGVYESWEECSKQTEDFPDADYKSFESKDEALEYVKEEEEEEEEDTGSEDDDEKGFCVYACGLSQFHGKKGQVAGLGVYFGSDNSLNSSERISGNTSLNRAQIQAAIKAAKQIKKSDKTEATVYTDSNYVINGITKWVKKWKTNGWKSSSGEEVKNKEDFEELDEAVQGLNLTWVHASGDSAPAGSAEAKKLAQAGLKLPLP